MFREKDLLENGSYKVETSESRLSQLDSGQNLANSDEKIGISGKSLDFLGESEGGGEGFRSKPSKPGSFSFSELMTISDPGQNLDRASDEIRFSETRLCFLRESVIGPSGFQSKPGNSGSQEVTLSYLCGNSKSGSFLENQVAGRSLLNMKGKGISMKGKGIVLENLSQEEKWVERDFLQLNDSEGGMSKRESEETERQRYCRKKPKLETLKLSLALPDVSLSLTASNAAPTCEPTVQPKPSSSMQSLALSNNNTQTTCSNDFTAPSLSYSYSRPFSHNPSCSLTRNSTDIYDNSVGGHRREADQIWHCGEGTNGSVHSHFKPNDDGLASSNHGSGVVYSLLNRARPFNRDSCYSFYKAAGSDSSSLFPSELLAKPRVDLCSIDSKSRSIDHLKGLDSLEDRKVHKLTRGERIVRDVITEPIHVMSQLFNELPVEAIESAKEYLNSLLASSRRKDELIDLQNLLEKRSDLTKETLCKCHRVQLEILVAVKFGLGEFVLGKIRHPTSELVEIFLFMRCPNVNCKSLLPVDDCDCKICSTKNGFCSQCMCLVCYKYDCASNTCSWVGCDTCSHWCHAACGIEKKLIRPGLSLKESCGTTGTQFLCLGCDHASEMFGFVKDVFMYCAQDWSLETLIKELDCVRRIFKGSEDFRGKELYLKAAELISRLERRVMSLSDACNFIVHFFTNKEITEELPIPCTGPRNPTTSQGCLLNDAVPLPSHNFPPKSGTFNMSSAAMLQDLLPYDFRHSTSKPYVLSDRHLEDELSGKFSMKDAFNSLESIVRTKEAEARMFQNRADEARKEVESYQQLVQAKNEKLEEEYAEKLAKLGLQETEERRRKKLEELKIIENSHSDYYTMKMRMQAEISGLLERMEATKQLWV